MDYPAKAQARAFVEIFKGMGFKFDDTDPTPTPELWLEGAERVKAHPLSKNYPETAQDLAAWMTKTANQVRA